MWYGGGAFKDLTVYVVTTSTPTPRSGSAHALRGAAASADPLPTRAALHRWRLKRNESVMRSWPQRNAANRPPAPPPAAANPARPRGPTAAGGVARRAGVERGPSHAGGRRRPPGALRSGAYPTIFPYSLQTSASRSPSQPSRVLFGRPARARWRRTALSAVPGLTPGFCRRMVSTSYPTI